MNAVFADTYYYLALLSEADVAHRQAVQLSREVAGRTVTTAWVLAEVADALAAPPSAVLLLGFVRTASQQPTRGDRAADPRLFEQGVELYAHRPDKSWSLTDCISFVVMQQRGLTDALTGDHHFEQAGFHLLLKQE